MRAIKITIITSYPSGTEMAKKSTEIWADKKSLTRSEFYGAYAAGLKPSYVLDVNPYDYHLGDVTVEDTVYEPQRVSVNGSEKAIIRTYEKNEISMELTVG